MLASRTRFTVSIFAGSLGLISCGGGGSASPIAPLPLAIHSAQQTKITAAYCKAHPLSDFKALPARAASLENVAMSGCGIGSTSFKSPALSQRAHVQVLNVPGAITASACNSYELFNNCGTLSYAINSPGTIVGYYLNSNAVLSAFARFPGGSYTRFQAPGAGVGSNLQQGTVPFEITNGGVIAGEYLDAQYVFHGFVRYNDGSYLTYEAPWASRIPNDAADQGTYTSTINSGGDTAGLYFDAQGVSRGFIRHRIGSFVQVIPSGSATSSVCEGDCLNNGGTAAGNYSGPGGITRGFIRSAAGSITTVAKPGSVATTLNGINNDNIVVGDYVDSRNLTWSFILGANKKRIAFQDPKSGQSSGAGTAALAINDAGDVTGIYADAGGAIHGFWRSKTGQFSEFDPKGSVETIPFDINANGTVTGYWYDAQGRSHGLIWTPARAVRTLSEKRPQ